MCHDEELLGEMFEEIVQFQDQDPQSWYIFLYAISFIPKIGSDLD